jgi:hypothetical protein
VLAHCLGPTLFVERLHLQHCKCRLANGFKPASCCPSCGVTHQLHSPLLMRLHAPCTCRAIRNDPSKLVLQHSLARLLLKLGQERAATSLLDRCLEVHKAHEEAGGAINMEALALDVDTYVLAWLSACCREHTCRHVAHCAQLGIWPVRVNRPWVQAVTDCNAEV